MVSPTSGAFYHAQVHAHQLGLFVLSLNRTLVLPQVAKGASSDIIDSTPSDGTLSYLTSQSEHLLPIRPYRNFCIAKKKKLDLNFESFPTLLVISPQRWHQLKGQRDQFAHRIMDLLRKDTVTPRTEKSPTASVPDVLVFNYKL
ncbi:hypothetical protein PPACK8108_LOCUS21278 [Phakopsora pachyrhizi]|uniref:Uncharacterized protein n=1 Tax=Phakopsora pachyrhizi TaxID=170000 RepID=A0AAV0BKH1_PHAPC|nr:hypothetical protein PPACK8108_LOCUS21278 [Phakopsora pachyrhizi]